MKKIFYSFFIIIITISICYTGYSVFMTHKARENYQEYVNFVLQSYCDNIIQSKFNKHASLFSIEKNFPDEIYGEEISRFGITGSIGFLVIRGRSTIYFTDYAPQDIYCSAMIDLNEDNKLSSKNIVTINIGGINYLPAGYANPESIKLTVSELNKLYPASVGTDTFFKHVHNQ